MDKKKNPVSSRDRILPTDARPGEDLTLSVSGCAVMGAGMRLVSPSGLVMPVGEEVPGSVLGRDEQEELITLRATVEGFKAQEERIKALEAYLDATNDMRMRDIARAYKRLSALEGGYNPKPSKRTEELINIFLTYLTRHGNGPIYVPIFQKKLGLSRGQMCRLTRHLKNDRLFVVARISNEERRRRGWKLPKGIVRGNFCWLSDREPDWEKMVYR
ncbi:MAG: hypothetical protein ACXQT2_01470 [Methanotrichaceae archaeon]